MAISTSCPSCGNGLKAPDQLEGKQIRCLKCKTSFKISASVALREGIPERSNGTPARSMSPKRRRRESNGPQAAARSG